MKHDSTPIPTSVRPDGSIDFSRLAHGPKGEGSVMWREGFVPAAPKKEGVTRTVGEGSTLTYGTAGKHVFGKKTKKGAVHYRDGYNKKNQALLGLNEDRSVAMFDTESELVVTLHPPVKSKARKWGWRK